MSKAQQTEPSIGVEWRDPPPRTKYDWAKIAQRLRRRPHKWLLIFEQDFTHKVNAINAGKVPDVHPDLGFQTRTVNNKRTSPRTCDLYMLFNPDRVDPLREQVRLAKKGGK